MIIRALVVTMVYSLLMAPLPVFADDRVVESKVDDFDQGAAIHVCWRIVKPGNPFLVSGSFDCESTIEAIKAPWPGGAINGDQLMGVIEKVRGDVKVKEVRIRSLSEGQKADDQSASFMTVDKGTNEFYNNYVIQDKHGTLAVFLDIEPVEK